MSPDNIPRCSPVETAQYLDRLDVVRADLTEQIWSEIHEVVQLELAKVETELRQRIANLDVESGCTKGRHFFLFSFRSFAVPQNSIDPVIAGITFTGDNGKVTLEADISGEQSGDLIVSLPLRTVEPTRTSLINAAQELSRSLCDAAHGIAEVLQDLSRNVELS